MAPSSSRYCFAESGCCLRTYRDGNEVYSEGEDEHDRLEITTDDAGSVDFGAYLFSLTGVSWKIDELAGGNANHTVRATRIGSGKGTGFQHHSDGKLESVGERLRGEDSVVVKHAPPFFYKSSSIEFDPYRQVRTV
jgi:hypothetical protein